MTDEQAGGGPDEQAGGGPDEQAGGEPDEATPSGSDEATAAVAPELTQRERRRIWLVASAPVVVVTVAVVGAALADRATLGDIVVGMVLYGGLLGLTAAVISHERAEAAHCPRCDATGAVRRPVCDTCGYDLAERPMWRCEQRHRRYVEAGLCGCGRRLHRIERMRGIDREIRRTLWAGAWAAAFLLGVVLLLPLVD